MYLHLNEMNVDLSCLIVIVCAEMKAVERLPGFDARVKLKDLEDPQQMNIAASSDTAELTADGLLEEDSLALLTEEMDQTESWLAIIFV